MKTNKLHIVILLMTAQILSAQNLGSIVYEAEVLYKKTKPSLVFPKSKNLLPSQHFYSELDTAKNINFWESELKRIESSQYKKDIGLVFKANAHYNFRNGFDEDTQNFNIGRVRAELEWNILKSGYTYNRTKSKRLENEMQILKYKSLQEERELMRRQFRIDYTYAINLENISFFTRFLAFENEYFDYLNKLYFKKYIKRERLIKVSHQINILKNQIEVLQKQNQILKDSVSPRYLSMEKLPFLQLHIDSLSLQTPFNGLELKKENIELQHKAINDLNLSFYVQETFNQLRNGHRFFPSVGIRFRAPIRFNHRKKIIETKKKIVVAQEIDKSVGKYNRLITLTSGYNEKLRDLQHQFKNWEFVEERIRILSVLKSELKNDETGTLLLELLEEEFKILENTIQLKRQLYTTLSHVYELTEITDIHSLVTPVQFGDINQGKQFAIQYSKNYSTNFQIQFLKAKGCKEVEVLEGNIRLQKALEKAKMPYKKVKNITYQLIEKAIQRELTEIQLKP